MTMRCVRAAEGDETHCPLTQSILFNPVVGHFMRTPLTESALEAIECGDYMHGLPGVKSHLLY